MAKSLFFLFLFICFAIAGHAADYFFNNDPIDVVIVSHPKDRVTLDLCIEGIQKNCTVRRVIVVSCDKLTDEAEWFDERQFPFSKNDVTLEIGKGDPKQAELFFREGHPPGWYYQQLLKLYAPFVIPEISSNVLVIDADSVFLNPVTFLNESYAGLLCKARQRQTKEHYVRFAKRLLPHYKQVYKRYNSVHHHMLFQKPILENLFCDVELKHGEPLWKAFCHCVDSNDKGASEYEVYHNYALRNCRQVKLRPLKRRSSGHINKINLYKNQGYHLVSFHSYMR